MTLTRAADWQFDDSGTDTKVWRVSWPGGSITFPNQKPAIGGTAASNVRWGDVSNGPNRNLAEFYYAAGTNLLAVRAGTYTLAAGRYDLVAQGASVTENAVLPSGMTYVTPTADELAVTATPDGDWAGAWSNTVAGSKRTRVWRSRRTVAGPVALPGQWPLPPVASEGTPPLFDDGDLATPLVACSAPGCLTGTVTVTATKKPGYFGSNWPSRIRLYAADPRTTPGQGALKNQYDAQAVSTGAEVLVNGTAEPVEWTVPASASGTWLAVSYAPAVGNVAEYLMAVWDLSAVGAAPVTVTRKVVPAQETGAEAEAEPPLTGTQPPGIYDVVLVQDGGIDDWNAPAPTLPSGLEYLPPDTVLPTDDGDPPPESEESGLMRPITRLTPSPPYFLARTNPQGGPIGHGAEDRDEVQMQMWHLQPGVLRRLQAAGRKALRR